MQQMLNTAGLTTMACGVLLAWAAAYLVNNGEYYPAIIAIFYGMPCQVVGSFLISPPRWVRR